MNKSELIKEFSLKDRVLLNDNDHVKRRYLEAIDEYFNVYSDADGIFSAPGRVEILGNHTDHNHGLVLTAAVDLDAIAIAGFSSDNTVRLISKGYGRRFTVDLSVFEPLENEKGTVEGIIRGVAAYLNAKGFRTGGFTAYVSSNVPIGSGLSSSAAFEVLIGCIFSHLYNNGAVSYIDLAIAGQFAENKYFGKPCGLMDQLASASGGLLMIDFAEPRQPIINKVGFDFNTCSWQPVIIKTGGSHNDLTHEYAAITGDMRDVSTFFGAGTLRGVKQEAFFDGLPKAVKKLSSRSLLRAMHYFSENERVQKGFEALEANDFNTFLECIASSGRSSWELLQNCYVPGKDQPLTLALVLAEKYLKGRGVVRVHGGGFGGTALAFVPKDMLESFTDDIDSVFGNGAAVQLNIRPEGAVKVL